MTINNLKHESGGDGYLDGQLLIAMPTMEDSRFERSVIYMCAHSPEGAWGLVVNRRSRRLTFPELLVQLDVIKEEDVIRLPEPATGLPVMRGGPVERERGFVLHSDDYFAEKSSIELEGGIALTASVEILRAIATGLGPQRALLALGYAGWGPGQLDREIQANGWLTCASDSNFLFGINPEDKYDNALGRLGVDPAMLSGEAGRA
ncbi:MAG: YqgE/AlgH family protein [Hyphomicrobiales bacterium]|nr:YqgE/AlgH family protein [Hyphomicrobiales bacterium]